MTLKSDQAKAFDKIKLFIEQPPGGVFLLRGAAGTGKTFLMKEVIEYIQVFSNKKIIVTAPTHKALNVLKRFIEPLKVTYSTIHSALALKEQVDGYGRVEFVREAEKIPPLVDYHFLIVDEASMINDLIFHDLLGFADTGLKILFVGDPYQIPPINQKNSLVFDKETRLHYNIPVVTLDQIIRQAEGSPIIQLAHTLKKAIFKPCILFDLKHEVTPFGSVHCLTRDEESIVFDKVLPMFKSETFKNDPDHVKIIAWRNKVVDAYNQYIRLYLFGKDIDKFLVGEKILFTRPVLEGNQVLISINEEAEIIGLTIEQEEIDDDVFLKYYKAIVQVYRDEVYNKYAIKVIHEDSQSQYDEIVGLLKNFALSHKQGSYQARIAWIDYYSFQKDWAQITYNYCITAHRSQGSTYQNAVVMAWDNEVNRNVYERNRVLYTACTRPSTNLWLIVE